MHQQPQLLSTELALKAFDADAAFSAALAQLQLQTHGQGAASVLAAANEAGFCWLFRPIDGEVTEVILRHSAGSEEKALGDDPLALILGLLGALPLPQEAQPAEPDKKMREAHKPADPVQAVDVAAESLAAATCGVVITELAQPGRAPEDPLSDQEKAAAIQLIKEMDPSERKSFAISFRSAFKVPASEKAIAPLIVQFQHLDFVDRFTGEAMGMPRP
jgi:hypothetical protein